MIVILDGYVRQPEKRKFIFGHCTMYRYLIELNSILYFLSNGVHLKKKCIFLKMHLYVEHVRICGEHNMDYALFKIKNVFSGDTIAGYCFGGV